MKIQNSLPSRLSGENKDRSSQSKKKTIKESLASLEEQLFEAERDGNTRKAKCIKMMINKLKKGLVGPLS